jgi:hypothetical protein
MLHLQPDNFITEADERILLDAIAGIAVSDFEMRGVVARRRVAFFGRSQHDRVYDAGSRASLYLASCRPIEHHARPCP